jgi:hypothetical protein
MSQASKIGVFSKSKDYQDVLKLISDIVVNEFKFKLNMTTWILIFAR